MPVIFNNGVVAVYYLTMAGYEYDIAESPKLLIGDTNISMVDEVKFLDVSVTFDRKLSWNAQTEALLQAAEMCCCYNQTY